MIISGGSWVSESLAGKVYSHLLSEISLWVYAVYAVSVYTVLLLDPIVYYVVWHGYLREFIYGLLMLTLIDQNSTNISTVTYTNNYYKRT